VGADVRGRTPRRDRRRLTALLRRPVQPGLPRAPDLTRRLDAPSRSLRSCGRQTDAKVAVRSLPDTDERLTSELTITEVRAVTTHGTDSRGRWTKRKPSGSQRTVRVVGRREPRPSGAPTSTRSGRGERLASQEDHPAHGDLPFPPRVTAEDGPAAVLSPVSTQPDTNEQQVKPPASR
jgi:hypothetical protein